MFIITSLLTGFVRKLAIRQQIVDIPNERSSHVVPTPRGGGLAIAIVWYLGLLVLFILGELESKLFWALMSGIVLSSISLIDDIRSLSPRIRMTAQLVAALLALYALGGSPKVDLGFVEFENVYLFTALSIPFIIWFINLFNFLDGIDGYLGMEGVFVFVGMWLFTGNYVLLLLVAAILGFLVWNWPAPKAKIFCGDVGSTLIGFNVAIFSLYFQNSGELSITFALILSGLFWFDASLTLFRRWRNKEKLSVAHRKHAYQRIVQSGFTHAKTVYYALGVNFLLGLLVYFAFQFQKFQMLFLLVAILVLWLVVRMIDSKKAFYTGSK